VKTKRDRRAKAANHPLNIFSFKLSMTIIHKLKIFAIGIKEKTPDDQSRVFGSVREAPIV